MRDGELERDEVQSRGGIVTVAEAVAEKPVAVAEAEKTKNKHQMTNKLPACSRQANNKVILKTKTIRKMGKTNESTCLQQAGDDTNDELRSGLTEEELAFWRVSYLIGFKQYIAEVDKTIDAKDVVEKAKVMADSCLSNYREKKRERRPKVVCLCGSTRFIEDIAVKQWELEKDGNIVLGMFLLPKYAMPVPNHGAEHEGVEKEIEELWLRKIDMSDEVFVYNKDGYIGEGTKRGIKYAKEKGKVVSYLENVD